MGKAEQGGKQEKTEENVCQQDYRVSPLGISKTKHERKC